MDKPFLGVEKENHIVPAKDAVLTIGGGITLDRHIEGFDEVGIWSRALTEAEARQLYNSGAGVQLCK